MDHISPFKIIVLGITIFIAVFSIFIFSGRVPIFQNNSNNKLQYSGKVSIWGTISKSKMDQYLSKFTSSKVGYTMEYTQLPSESFRSSLAQAISFGSGPDLIIAPHDVILTNEAYLNITPYAEYSEAEYKSTYVDASQVFLRPMGIIAFPLGIDTMVLFYNKELQNQAGIVDTPKDWNQILKIAEEHTEKGAVSGLFKVSIIPFGAYSNYIYNKDMVMTLVNQLGGEAIYRSGYTFFIGLESPVSESGASYIDNIVRFMSGFANPSLNSFTWSPRMPDALTAFTSNGLMYYPAYISDYNSILEANPKLQFDYVMMPQIPDREKLHTGSRVLGISMLTSSRNMAAAKDAFLTFGSNKDFANSIAAIAGEPSPRKDTLAGADSTQYAETIGKSILLAKPFYDIDKDQTSLLVDNMFQSIISNRKEISEAVKSFVISLKKLYNIDTY